MEGKIGTTYYDNTDANNPNQKRASNTDPLFDNRSVAKLEGAASMAGILQFSLYFTFWCLINMVSTQTQLFNFVSNHQNTIAGSDTEIPGLITDTSMYEDVVGSCYIFQLWTQPTSVGPAIFLYSPTATSSNRLIGTLMGEDVDYLRRPLLDNRVKLYAYGTGSEDRLQVHSLAFDTTTLKYTQLGWGWNNQVFSVTIMIESESPSNFVYYLEGDSNTETNTRKWDKTKPGPEPAMVHTTTYFSNPMQFRQGLLWMLGHYVTTMYYVDVTTMSLVSSLTGTSECRDAIFHETESQVVYLLLANSPYGVAKVSIGATSYTTTHLMPLVSGQSGVDWSRLVSLGTTGCLGMIRYYETNMPFRVYYKSDLTEVPANLYTPALFPDWVDESLVPGLTFGRPKTEVGFGIQVLVGGVRNFQSWKSIIDVCLSRTGLVCTSCPLGTYLDQPGSLDNSCVPSSQGVDLATGFLTACQDPNCEQCGLDHLKCSKCLSASASPYLLTNRCVGLAEIPVTLGVDTSTKNVVPCLDPNCLNCRADYQVCAACDFQSGYKTISGACVYDDQSRVKVISAIYDPQQLIGSITFDANILLEGQPDDLAFTVLDIRSSIKYTCEELGCAKDFQARGVSIRFDRVLDIEEAQIILSLSPLVRILRVNDSRLFIDYPVSISAANLSSNKNRSVPRLPVNLTINIVKTMQLPSTLFFAAMYPSLTPLFDEVFADITVVAFYPSPPMALLDEAILSFKNVTIVPFQIPNLFEGLLGSEKCEPSLMLERYEYGCGFLANFGVDLTILLFMLAINLTLKLSLMLMRKPRLTKISSTRQEAGKAAETDSRGETPTQDRRSEKRYILNLVEWLDQHFGFLLLAAKVEGKQAEYLVYSLQDLWTVGASTSRLFSTVAAVLMLAHPVFSLYVLQRLVEFICKEYRVLHWFGRHRRILSMIRIETRVESAGANLDPSEPRGIQSQRTNTTIMQYSLLQSRPSIDLENNKTLSGRFFYPWRFWFDGATIPVNDLRLLLPLVSLVRHILKALIIVGKPDSMRAQCMMGLVIEVCYFLFVWNYSVKLRLVEVFTERALFAASVAFLIGKYFSHSVDEEFRQTDLANWMLGLILLKMLLTAVATLWTVGMWARDLYRSRQSRQKSDSIKNASAFGKEVHSTSPTKRKPEVDTVSNLPSAKFSHLRNLVRVETDSKQPATLAAEQKIQDERRDVVSLGDKPAELPQRLQNDSPKTVSATQGLLKVVYEANKRRGASKVPQIISRLTRQRKIPN